MNPIFFDGAFALWRTFIGGLLAYVFLIVALRFSGKRALSKLNAFDFVVTIALGSTLSAILINRNVSLAQGALALSLLLGLQYLVSWGSHRQPWVRRLVTGEPALLVHRGEFLQQAMRRERITREELEAAARSNGLRCAEEAESIVLETDGSLSVVRKDAGSGPDIA